MYYAQCPGRTNATQLQAPSTMRMNLIMLCQDHGICDLRSDPSAHSSTVQAREVRDDLKNYFFEEGAISFQWAITS